MSIIPVNGETLKWARQLRMLDLAQAANMLALTEDELSEIERNERSVNLGLFEKFSQKYKLPQATLFRKQHPHKEVRPNDFRTFNSEKPNLSFDFSIAFSKILSLKNEAVKIIEDDGDIKPANLPRISFDKNPYELGEIERRRISSNIEDQLKWPSQEAFRRWRALIESQGIFVFLQEFPIQDCRGFTIYDDERAPIIVVNKAEAHNAARTFTLIHEYAHILLRKPGLSDLDKRNPTEAFCNQFTAGFLMPPEVIRAVIKIWPNEPKAWEDSQIKYWAGRLKVSQWSLALRLEELNLAPKGFHKKFSWHTGYTPKKKSEKSGGLDPHLVKLSEFGGHYVSNVLDALKRSTISETQAAEALDMSIDCIHKADAYVTRAKQFEHI